MADILIRGMEMPKFCGECPLKESMYDVGYICLPLKEPIKVNIYKDRDNACPLVHLPEGHGRLIDADALADKMKKTPRYFDVKFDLDDAPTIVPAEGGTDNG